LPLIASLNVLEVRLRSWIFRRLASGFFEQPARGFFSMLLAILGIDWLLLSREHPAHRQQET